MPTSNIINPLDYRADSAIGIDLPLFGDRGSVFKLNYTTLDQASANARNLLLTNQGERIMQPTFGCDLYRSLFDNLTDYFVEETKSKIKEQFDYWLPYVFINDLQIKFNESDPAAVNKVLIQMVISLQNNKFDTRTIDLVITQA